MLPEMRTKSHNHRGHGSKRNTRAGLARLAAIATLYVAVGALRAEEPVADRPTKNPPDAEITLLWENDGRAWNPLNRSDRHYTNGVKVVGAFHPAFADQLATELPTLGEDFSRAQTAAGVVVGQNIYTPRDDRATELIPDDRPYAGWVYLGGFLQRANGNVLDHVEFDLGLVGPYSGAREAQDMFHDLIGVDKFQGWDHQLETEVAFNFVLQRRVRWLRGDVGSWVWDLTPHVGTTLGTVNINLAAGATARIGWQLPEDFGPGNIGHPLDYASARVDEQAVYLFTRAEGKAVARDLFIQGNTFRDSHGVTAEPLVGSLAWGLAWQINRRCVLAYSQTFLSKEFKGQENHDSYGSYQLTFAFDF